MKIEIGTPVVQKKNNFLIFTEVKLGNTKYKSNTKLYTQYMKGT